MLHSDRPLSESLRLSTAYSFFAELGENYVARNNKFLRMRSGAGKHVRRTCESDECLSPGEQR